VLARVAGDEAEILTLAVVPTLRRRGIGRCLLGRTIEHAACLGARALFLEVAADNAAARGLYAAHGLAEIGRRTEYYPDGGDALVLRIALSREAAASER
jgi:ribosomal-protein-alanine N-acetyltransferase